MSKWLAPLAILSLLLFLPADSLAQRGGGGGRGGGRGFGGFAPPRPVAGHGVEVPGYRARLDEPSQIDQPLMFTPTDDGMHAMTGPTAVFWDPEQEASGEYEVSATFTLNKPASHQVAYGLFIGGGNLTEDDQRYTYFVIRQDGQYLLKQRRGGSTSEVAGDWAPHEAVMAIGASGSQTNQLSIRVTKDRVMFLANGKEVASQPAATMDTAGVVGLRIGHGLDLDVKDFTVE